MTKMPFLAVTTTGVLAALSGCGMVPDLNYNNDVAPILSKYCAECHLTQGEGTEKSGFEVGSYDTVMQGTKYGPVVIEGDSTSSTLYLLVASKVDESIQMPHDKEKLSAEEIAVIQQWIHQGAKKN